MFVDCFVLIMTKSSHVLCVHCGFMLQVLSEPRNEEDTSHQVYI